MVERADKFENGYIGVHARGVATGVCGYIPPPPKKKKTRQSKQTFYGVEMTPERQLNMRIEVLYPRKLLYPPNKFLATPWCAGDGLTSLVF